MNQHITSERKHGENEEECNFDSSFYEEDNNEAKRSSYLSQYKQFFKTIERQEIELFLKRCKQFNKHEFTMIDIVSKIKMFYQYF